MVEARLTWNMYSFFQTKLVWSIVMGTFVLLQSKACLSVAQRNVSFLKLFSQAKSQVFFLAVQFIEAENTKLFSLILLVQLEAELEVLLALWDLFFQLNFYKMLPLFLMGLYVLLVREVQGLQKILSFSCAFHLYRCGVHAL